MSDDHDIADTAIQHGGWIAAALVATWGWILRMSMREMHTRLERIEDKQDAALARISHIEGCLGLNGSSHKNGKI